MVTRETNILIVVTSNFRGNSMIDQVQDYFLWGCVVTEVELDLLTGEKKVKNLPNFHV